MFPKSKVKRFNEIVSCAPPVGTYNVNDDTGKKSRTALFDRTKRFTDLKRENSLSSSSIFSDVSVDSSECSSSARKVKGYKSADLQQIKIDYNTCKDKLAATIKLLEASKKSKQETKKKLNEYKRNENDSIIALKAVQTKCKDMENRMAKSEESMHEQLENLNQRLASATQSHSDSLDTIATLEKANNHKRLEFDETVQGMQTQLKVASDISDTVKEENVLLQQKLESRETEIKKLKEELQRNEMNSIISLKSIVTKCKEMEKSMVITGDHVNERLEDLANRLTVSNQSHYECLKKIATLETEHCADQIKSNEIVRSLETKYEIAIEKSKEIQQENELLKQKVESRDTRIEELTDEVGRKEDEMTESLRSITVKFQAMEKSTADSKIKNVETEDILRKQLDATKQSFRLCKQDLISLRSTYEVQQRSAIITITQLEEKERDNMVMRERCMSLDEELLKLDESKNNGHLHAQIEIWKNKYEELAIKIGPFQECLDNFALEQRTLLADNSGKEEEIASLAHRYAEILSHQNTKQKIKHLIKLKENMMDMKKELMQLKSQSVKDKATIRKLKNENRPKTFNKNDAFKHPLSNIENCQDS